MPSSSHFGRKPSAWLRAPGSLTRHLQRACPGVLRVHVLGEGWVRAETVAAKGLRVRAGVRIWQREVLLRCAETPYVHALTWMTASGRRALGLERLGGRPLGHVLFRKAARRVSREIVKPREGRPWARRTLYVLRGHRLLVQEEFLAGLPALRR